VASRVSCEFNPTPPMSHGGLVTLASRCGRQPRHAGHDRHRAQSCMTDGPASEETKALLERHDPQSTGHHPARVRRTTSTSSTGQRRRHPVPSGIASRNRRDSGAAMHSDTPAAYPRTIRSANRSRSARDSRDISGGQPPGTPTPSFQDAGGHKRVATFQRKVRPRPSRLSLR